jgi:signal transduction histidine kinase
MLDACFVWVKFTDGATVHSIVSTCSEAWNQPDIIDSLEPLSEGAFEPQSSAPVIVPSLGGLVYLANAGQGGIKLAAGSRNSDFPAVADGILLSVAANAIIGKDLTEQRKLDPLDKPIEARTAELEEANKTLIREIEAFTDADNRLKLLREDLLQAARLSVASQMTATLAHELIQPLGAAQNAVHAARLILGKGNSRTTPPRSWPRLTTQSATSRALAKPSRDGEIL